jgi:hypothetical protein
MGKSSMHFHENDCFKTTDVKKTETETFASEEETTCEEK